MRIRSTNDPHWFPRNQRERFAIFDFFSRLFMEPDARITMTSIFRANKGIGAWWFATERQYRHYRKQAGR